MAAFIAALTIDPTIRIRRAVVVALVVTLVAGAAVAARRMGEGRPSVCGGGAGRLVGVWEAGGAPSSKKDAVRRAFVATGLPYADKAFAGAARYLDEYASAWLAMYGDACEATHVRGEQSEEVLDLRMGCLGERLTELRALTDELSVANAKVVENAVSAVSSLALVQGCADVTALRAVVKPPTDEKARRRVDELREQRARVTPLRFAGKCDEVRQLVGGLTSAAKDVAYAPLIAETELSNGLVEDTCGGAPDAMISFYRAAFLTAVTAGLDHVAIQAASFVAFAVADRMRNLEEARTYQAFARALLARVGGDVSLEADLDYDEGALLQYEGKVDEALAALDKARAAQEKLRGKDHPFVVLALNSAGSALVIGRQYERALGYYRRGQEIILRTTGASSPYGAMLDANAGEALNALHRYGEATSSFERARASWLAMKATPSILAYAETGLGIALLGEGRPSDAVAPLERSLAARLAAKAPPDLTGEARFALARALWSRPSSRERARELGRQALADFAQEKAPTAPVPDVAAWLRAPGSRV